MNRSESIGQLSAALAKAQAHIRGAAKDTKNDHLKNRYADLASTWDACRDALSSNGLAVTQLPLIGDDGHQYLDTVLCHESGEWVASRIPLIYGDEKGIKPIQAMGSAITYARRYGLAAIVGVCPEDDDGEGAGQGQGGYRQHQHRPEPRREPERPAPPPADGKAPAVEPLGDLIARRVEHYNALWAADAPGAPPLAPHANSVMQHFVTNGMEAGTIRPDDVNKPGTDRRDDARCWRALEGLYRRSPTRFAKALDDYLDSKLDDARAELAPEAAR